MTTVSPMHASIRYEYLPYHQQDDPTLCGAACTQMVLHQLSVDHELLTQDQLASIIEGCNREDYGKEGITWLAAPDGIEGGLNDLLDKNRDFYNVTYSFDLLEGRNADEVTRAIISSITTYGVAGIALVYGNQHWLLVRGYLTDGDPRNTGSYVIRGLDLYDPEPPLSEASPTSAASATAWPPPHVDDTDGCGKGEERGIKENFVTYEEWTSIGGYAATGYMTGVPASSPSYWSGKFLAIRVVDVGA